MMNDFAIIIQARNGSSRLPRKMVLDFYRSKGIFEIILDNLSDFFPPDKLILATTTAEQDNILADIARKKGIRIHRGNENDVLQRFIDTAEAFHIKNIVRVCADNPFLMPSYIRPLTQYENYDYVSYTLPDQTPVIKTHWGLFAEFTRLDTLLRIKEETDEPVYHEHVTNYIYTHPDKFSIKYLPLPEEIRHKKNFRLTLDTKDDFDILKKIYAQWINTDKSLKSLVNIVESDKDILNAMLKQIRQNEK